MIPEEVLKNTLVDLPRLNSILSFLKMTEHTVGDNAEVGVYKGGTALLIAKNSTKKLFLFDTFNGMPEVNKDLDLHNTGDFNDTSVIYVSELLKDQTNVSIHKGLFPKETGIRIRNRLFSFVHLDCDIYESVKRSLEFFYPRMYLGGIIALDDYNELNCPGAKLAVDEFFKDKPEKPFSFVQSQVAYIIGV